MKDPRRDRPGSSPLVGTRLGLASPGEHPALPPDALADLDAEASEEAEASARVGQYLAGKYRLKELLGIGGMGAVYLAEQTTLQKEVALKVLRPALMKQPKIRERFLQEARAAARIAHENIVDITDFGTTDDGGAYIGMEYLEGQDLASLIEREAPLPWNRVKPIAVQLCRALAAAHDRGVIHRDLKPENIFLVEREDRRDFVKVLDFGIAKMSADEQVRLTQTGVLVGTPDYMSPEQARGKELDHRTDIYSAGVIIYEMLVGRVPFEAPSFVGVLAKHMNELPEPPTRVAPDAAIPPEAEAIVLCALAKEQERRFPSMPAMARALAAAPGRLTRPTGALPEQPLADPDPTLRLNRPLRARKRSPWSWVLVLAGALALAGALVALARAVL